MNLSHLNDMQQRAVINTEGPVLILAGAGSGKTTVLTNRIAYLIEKLGVYPQNILAITFTNKAAKEMKERVERLLGKDTNMWISTFHSACVRILRRDIDKIGYTRDFVIYDSSDQKIVLKEIIKELNINEDYYSISMVQGKIGQAKDHMLGPRAFNEKYMGDFQMETIGRIYEKYQKKLRKNNALDFDDLIFKTVELFLEDPVTLRYYQEKFQYIMVDEYQDTSELQYKLISLLAKKHQNLCVVGDDDQSIYSFRGADIRNILSFEDDFPNAKVIKLEQNYRSTQNILDAANSVIENNQKRKKKVLWTSNKKGDKLGYYGAMNEHEEAQFIIDKIRNMVRTDGKNYSEFAILYRTNAQSRVFEERLMKSGVPYKIFGGTRFYDRKEIKDMIAYLRLIQNPVDDVSLKRVINVPKRGIGDRTIEKIQEMANKTGESMFSVLLDTELISSFSRRIIAGIREFSSIINQYRQKKEEMVVTEIIKGVMEDSGYIEELQKENTVESQSRIENLQEFISVAMDFEKNNEVKTLEEFLSNVSLVSDLDHMEEQENAVVLMTLHSAKGLEFPVVFLGGMEEGVFPSGRSIMENEDVPEERRLCYVGITRAKEILYLTHAKLRTLYGRTNYNKMSRFISEIADSLIDMDKKEIEKKEKMELEPSSGIYRGTTLAKNPTPKNIGNEEIRPGMKIKHGKFGIGTVISVKGQGEKKEITIAFDNAGIKRLVLGFSPIEVLG